MLLYSDSLIGSRWMTSKYQIVSEIEADLKEKRISVTAPIIRPLIGHMVGDIVEVELSSGTLEIEIMSIQRPS